MSKSIQQTGHQPSILPALILLASAVLALVLRNSAIGEDFEHFWHLKFGFGVLELSVHQWINDFLMVFFFLLVGIEIKREVLVGQLSSFRQALLPILGAIGGMAVPAGIFLLCNQQNAAAIKGWAIPTATDIAFALGILALVGRSLPKSLRVFLTALAIIDDLGAILIIAFVYTASVNYSALLAAAVALGVLYAIGKIGKLSTASLLVVGLVVWYFVMTSGVHATIAGVLTALMIPVGENHDGFDKKVEHNLISWSNYLILPLFALANSGIPLHGMSWNSISAPVTLGCLLGLLIGKQLGVFVACSAVIKLGFSKLPDGATWTQFYGVTILTGIGFTMSLFITALAFGEGSLSIEARLGVLAGSALSAIFGALILRQNRSD